VSDVWLRSIKWRVGFEATSAGWLQGRGARVGSAVPTPSQKCEAVGSAALGSLVCTVQMDTVPANAGAYCLISYTGCWEGVILINVTLWSIPAVDENAHEKLKTFSVSLHYLWVSSTVQRCFQHQTWRCNAAVKAKSPPCNGPLLCLFGCALPTPSHGLRVLPVCWKPVVFFIACA